MTYQQNQIDLANNLVDSNVYNKHAQNIVTSRSIYGWNIPVV